MSFATATVTQAEAVALHRAAHALAVATREFDGGGKDPAKVSVRFTNAELDTLVTAMSTAITNANA